MTSKYFEESQSKINDHTLDTIICGIENEDCKFLVDQIRRNNRLKADLIALVMSNNISCRNGIRLELSSTHNDRAHGSFSAITRSVYKRMPPKK